MKQNKLTIQINKPVSEIFAFTTTPPNSTLWIDSIIKEETNEWPVRMGTIYKLQSADGRKSEVIMTAFHKNKMIEWVSEDGNYHCRYAFRPLSDNETELTYFEWVKKGEIDDPFSQEVLEKLKGTIETV
jgi:hypothetical protein